MANERNAKIVPFGIPMKILQQNEIELIGNWELCDGNVVADKVTERINWLVNDVLQKICDSPTEGAWESLFQDPTDGRYWEQVFPNSSMHGGGPPTLQYISELEAKKKYDIP